MKTTASLCLALLSFTFASQTLAANWPAWRGPDGAGVTSEKNLPLSWDTNTNVRWRVPLPDKGNSTPIIWGNRVFVTQATTKDNRRALLCFDRAKGEFLWQQGVTPEDKEPTHGTNPQCSASPVTDGERVIAWFGSGGLYCYDLEGKELWHRDLGRQRHIWGNAASPAIHGGLCYLNFGPGEPSFLLAVDKKTGKEIWRVAETNADSGVKGQEHWVGSWSTPVFIEAGGRDQLLMSWPKRLIAFEPKTGKELWSCSGLNELVYTSPLYDKGIVVAMGGFGGKALAARAGGEGDVTESRRLWHHPKSRQRIGSGAIYDGRVYILTDPGFAECWELESGKLVWEKRVSGPGAKADNWSSMVLSGDRLYGINQSGDGIVLRASPEFEQPATNPIGETTMASIAPSDGELFIRTHRALWCIAEKR